jgi:hypothetical protein
VCLAELHEAPDPKNQLHSNFFSQTHPTPAAPPRICSKKRWTGPNSMVFVEYLKRCSTRSKFHVVGGNYPPLPLVTQKRCVLLFFFPCRPHLPSSCCAARTSLPHAARAPLLPCEVAPDRSAAWPRRPCRRSDLPSPCCDTRTSPPRVVTLTPPLPAPPEHTPARQQGHAPARWRGRVPADPVVRLPDRHGRLFHLRSGTQIELHR